MPKKCILNHFIKIERTKEETKKKTHTHTFDHLIYLSTHIYFSYFLLSLFFDIMGCVCVCIVIRIVIAVCRAVVWADFIQFLLMMFAIVTVVVLGMNKVGGFANVWSAAERGGRLIIFK